VQQIINTEPKTPFASFQDLVIQVTEKNIDLDHRQLGDLLVDELQHGAAASLEPGKRTLTESITPMHTPMQARLDATVTPSEPATSPSVPQGAALEPGVRSHFERAFDADLSSVRVGESSDVGAHGAQAFAHGDQIAMRPGAYDPASPGGMDLLGHELTHVLQQRAGRVSAPQGKSGFHQDPALEHEADALGARAARGERVEVPGAAGRGAAGTADTPRQARLAVALRTQAGGPGVANTHVADIDIVGRPKDTPKSRRAGGGSTEGDHATAWGVIRIGVVNRLRGQTLAAAVTGLKALLDEARKLPGARPDRIDAMDAARKTAAVEASKRVDAGQVAADNAVTANDVDRTISCLQTFAADYLSYRNAIGLVVLNRDAAATSDGESQPLKWLQHWETAWTEQVKPNDDERAIIVNAMGALFSPKVAEEGGADRDQLPGQLLGENKAAVQEALSQQHLATLRSSYPNLAARLGEAMTPTLGAKWEGGRATDVPDQPTRATSAIQIAVDDRGIITSVTMAGRSKHGMGDSEGSHTTAHGLFERMLQRLCGQDIPTAKATLDSITAEVRALPGAAATRTTRMPPVTGDVISDTPAMSPLRIELFKEATSALDTAATAANAQANVATLQAYAEAVMFFRNTMGLVTVGGGNVPGGQNEPEYLATLDAMGGELAKNPQAKISRLDLVNAISCLFDTGTLNTYLRFDQADEIEDDDASNSPADAPGRIPGEAFEETVNALIEQHLRSTFTAYPQLRSKVDANVLKDVCTLILTTKEGFTSFSVDGTAYLDPRASGPPAAPASTRKQPPDKTADEYVPEAKRSKAATPDSQRQLTVRRSGRLAGKNPGGSPDRGEP
jgi:hypothetical protein